jgi:hypothetical protein
MIGLRHRKDTKTTSTKQTLLNVELCASHSTRKSSAHVTEISPELHKAVIKPSQFVC